MAYRDEVLADSPAAYYRLGELAGTAAVDEVGGPAGTYGRASLGAGRLLLAESTRAPHFNGTSSYVQVPDRAAVDVGDTFTIEAWIILEASGIQGIADKGIGGPIFRTDAATRLLLRRNSVGDIVTSTSALPLNQLLHVVGVKNGAVGSWLYVQGEDVSGRVTNQTVANTAADLFIGADDAATDDWLTGYVGEVAIYPTPLSKARVQAHFAAGAAVVRGGLPVLPDNRLALSSAAPVATPRAGFAVTSAGALAASTAGGSWDRGFLRTAAGALCVAVDAAGSWSGGFLRTAAGALCVTATGPFTNFGGFWRDSAGRLAVQFT